MQEEKLVSVVIPTYNRANTILRAINSVLNQTFQKFEIIIVDDGSTDSTKEIIETLKDERIKYIYQENAGAQVARNNGLENSSGTYISFLDSDDEWCENFIEEFIKEFENHEVDCVYCLSGMLNQSNELKAVREDTLSGHIYRQALKQGYITSPTFLMVKKTCFNKIGKWDESLKACQDDDICFRLAKEFKFSLISKPLAIFHTDGENRIMTDNYRYSHGWEVLWDKYRDEVIKECGVSVIAQHYYEVAKLYAQKGFYVDFHRAIFKSICCECSSKQLALIFQYLLKSLYNKEKKGNKRKITILGFIKISYKKKDKS